MLMRQRIVWRPALYSLTCAVRQIDCARPGPLAGQSLERSYTLRMAAAVAGKQYRKDEDHAARQISQVHVWHPIAEQAISPAFASLSSFL